jgi:hypothetical protein
MVDTFPTVSIFPVETRSGPVILGPFEKQKAAALFSHPAGSFPQPFPLSSAMSIKPPFDVNVSSGGQQGSGVDGEDKGIDAQ